jgi:hypothetical protein
MSSIIRERWIWIIIGACILVGVAPWLLIFFILQMPTTLKVICVLVIICSWGIAAGYKDWLIDRRKKEKLPGSLAESSAQD